ncbi:hypothetical protein AGMMS50239_25360 [Bacteroidia bacterium]|nr:hypothetical protein AGMMS50239_25220 [Bacteroidia bacterium]GHT65485.1 hypothetical protein AGMMS50239_25360 [Bacteroidia bacterium]
MIAILKKNLKLGSRRSQKVKNNIAFSLVLQGINILVSFLLIPICISYVSTSQYGLWLTLSSIISWFSLMDIGLGSGLKNKLTIALANNDIKLAKSYISTTYFVLGLGAIIMSIICLFIYDKFNWSSLLNQDSGINPLLSTTVLIIFLFFFLRLVVQLINTILIAHIIPAGANFLNTVSSILVLLIIFVLTKTTKGNLLILSLVISSVSVIVYIVASIILFKTRFKYISPSFKSIDLQYIKPLMNLGFGFFFIQISTIVLFQSNNFIIIKLFTNEDVVVYNVAYKLFSIITILFNIIIQPFWTAFTDAWEKKEVSWIQTVIKKLYRVWIGIFTLGIIILIFSPWIYSIWMGDSVSVPFLLSVFICLYFGAFTYGGIFNMFINGIGKLRIQMISLAISMFLYIPIVLFLVKIVGLGVYAIPIGLLISNFYSLFLSRIQYNKLILGKAVGIWNK